MLLAEKSTCSRQQETQKFQNHELHLPQPVTDLNDRGRHQRGKHAVVNGRVHVPRLHSCYKLVQWVLNRVQELRESTSVVQWLEKRHFTSEHPRCPPPGAGVAPRVCPWLTPTSPSCCRLKSLSTMAIEWQKPTRKYLPATVSPKAQKKPPRTKVSIISIEKERQDKETSLTQSKH